MKKTLSVLLALLLLASAAGCSETTASPEETANTGSTAAASPEETEAETEDPGLDDGLPEVNYDGYGFHIAFFGGEDVNIEEETGEALNDAIFRRNQAMDERFGIQLEGVEYDDYNKATEAVKAAVTAGTNDFDAAFLHMVSASTAAAPSNQPRKVYPVLSGASGSVPTAMPTGTNSVSTASPSRIKRTVYRSAASSTPLASSLYPIQPSASPRGIACRNNITERSHAAPRTHFFMPFIKSTSLRW